MLILLLRTEEMEISLQLLKALLLETINSNSTLLKMRTRCQLHTVDNKINTLLVH